MIAAALITVIAPLAPSYAATTDERRRLTIEVRQRRITRATTTVVDYECESFGNIGPIRVRIAPKARVDSRGRFSFVTGHRAERIGVAGRLRPDGNATGRNLRG